MLHFVSRHDYFDMSPSGLMRIEIHADGCFDKEAARGAYMLFSIDRIMRALIHITMRSMLASPPPGAYFASGYDDSGASLSMSPVSAAAALGGAMMAARSAHRHATVPL